MKTDEENLEELREFLTKEGYHYLRVVPGRGICGLMGFMYTVGLCHGLDKGGYKGRWCYPQEKAMQALMCLAMWDGKDDPMGEWIKYKGNVEYSNPNFIQDEF